MSEGGVHSADEEEGGGGGGMLVVGGLGGGGCGRAGIEGAWARELKVRGFVCVSVAGSQGGESEGPGPREGRSVSVRCGGVEAQAAVRGWWQQVWERREGGEGKGEAGGQWVARTEREVGGHRHSPSASRLTPTAPALYSIKYIKYTVCTDCPRLLSCSSTV